MASEVMKMAFTGNMHVDIRVIEVTELNFEVKYDPLEAAVAKITLQLLERLPSCYRSYLMQTFGFLELESIPSVDTKLVSTNH